MSHWLGWGDTILVTEWEGLAWNLEAIRDQFLLPWASCRPRTLVSLMKSPIFRKLLSCHCCFPQLEGLTNHNTESFVLYYWGKESGLSSRAILYKHYWWCYLWWRRKGKRILVIQGAYYLSCMNLDQFPPKYLDTSMKWQHINRLWLFLHYLPV